MKYTLLATSVALSLSAPSLATAVDSTSRIEQIKIIGSKAAVDNLPGSNAFIDQETLENYAITDISRVLAKAPGVYFVEEDGYGLRPNIGMRGNSADRSEKITVMEDGVLAAPAPYASPAAYYFPTIGRMSAIEVLKGGSSIKYGPRTSGGVINLVSREVPDADFAGKVDIALGSDGFTKVHTFAGGQDEQKGYVAEVFDYRADGFKALNAPGDTGFAKTDLLGKFESYLDSAKQHHLEFKAKYSEESSDETYLGLLDSDYINAPLQRYSASQNDEMTTEHTHFSIHYDWFINDQVDVSVIAYQNDFARNWYKVSKVGGRSLGSGAEEIAAQIDNATYVGTALPEVQIKANNRKYLSRGIQSELAVRSDYHDLRLGLRLHEDDMDRFQWVDKYVLGLDRTMTITSRGTPGTDSNRIDSAKAISAFVHDTYTYQDLTVKAGVRYEKVDLHRDDWGKTDPQRTASPSQRDNSVSAVLPAIGFTYQSSDDLVLLGGVQKAFAPPSPGNQNADQEEGWNYEAGLRFSRDNFNAEVIYYMTRLDNLHGNCTASQGCDDELIGNQYNAGQVDIDGIEASASVAWQLGRIQIPISVNYTSATAKFTESFSSELDSWGDVNAGDSLPYLPETMFQLETGVRGSDWHVLVSYQYMDAMRTTAGSGAIAAADKVPSRGLVNVSAQYTIDRQQQVYMVMDNITDKTYIATRQHGGIQVGKPRGVQIGYRYTF
ncbi:MAG: TonB-dependent receptor [Glaciecola sp.]|jgi:Fe(3+) dicitrate transport protein